METFSYIYIPPNILLVTVKINETLKLCLNGSFQSLIYTSTVYRSISSRGTQGIESVGAAPTLRTIRKGPASAGPFCFNKFAPAIVYAHYLDQYQLQQ